MSPLAFSACSAFTFSMSTAFVFDAGSTIASALSRLIAWLLPCRLPTVAKVSSIVFGFEFTVGSFAVLSIRLSEFKPSSFCDKASIPSAPRIPPATLPTIPPIVVPITGTTLPSAAPAAPPANAPPSAPPVFAAITPEPNFFSSSVLVLSVQVS